MFEINDDLSGYSTEELTDLITQANEALDELFGLDDPTDEQVTQAEGIVAAIASLEAEQASRQQAHDERTEKMAALRAQRVEASEQPSEDDADGDDDSGDGGDDDSADAEQPAPEQPAPVQAAAKPKPTPRQTLARRTTRPKTPEPTSNGRLVVTAAADVPDFATGGGIDDMVSVGTATINRMRGFPEVFGIPDASMQKYPVASFRTEFPDDLVMDKGKDDQDVVDFAAKESRLPGGSLVAAGGWCAPSETLYDFCTSVTTDGLISLPEVQAKRGGIRYTQGPDFAALYAAVGFCQTEAQAIAGTAKTCYTVPCPGFTEVRLDACGICIKVPLLTQAGYPELVAETLSQSLIAHQHKMSVKAITAMVTASGAAVLPADLKSSTSNTLDAVELVANTLRQNYRMGFNETLEVVAPFWLKGNIRADLTNRMGADTDSILVTDAQIDSFFAARNVSVQWVYNWQPLAEGEEGYPATAQIMVYPAGTFVKATNDIINLSAVYDAASLTANEYVGLFFEEGIAIIQRCFKSKLVTIPLCAGGQTGAASTTACFTLT
jgi:hypothetical protein